MWEKQRIMGKTGAKEELRKDLEEKAAQKAETHLGITKAEMHRDSFKAKIYLSTSASPPLASSPLWQTSCPRPHPPPPAATLGRWDRPATGRTPTP